MWSREDDIPHRAGRTFEADLQLRYLAPGAFTVLAPGGRGPPPDPPSANSRHRLTPHSKKNRNAAFSIIAEPGSNASSRSPSPSGRVSPFRGRGFNPVGSRHASPLPSPPLDERKFNSAQKPQQPNSTSNASKATNGRSKIPTLSRRGSTAGLFGDNGGEDSTRPGRTKSTNLNKQLSQSLSSISPRNVSNRPPPSPKRTRRYAKAPAFQKLSPIIGSSPERTPNQRRLQSQSSPSKIPRSRSQPPSARISPNVSGSVSRLNSRNPSRATSRNPSRESSPSKINPKPSYKNVKAKVNSYHTKPKVPPKPQVPKNEKSNLERKESVRTLRANDNNTNSRTQNNKTNNNSSNSNNKNLNHNDSSKKKDVDRSTTKKTNSNSSNKAKEDEIITLPQSSEENDNEGDEAPSGNRTKEEPMKLVDMLGPSTTTVVSTTTTTVTKPLKIEANFDITRDDNDKNDNSVYLPDGRALSATSVSTAMNRMNDTVLDTKTLMKESTMSSRLQPPPPSSGINNNNANNGTNNNNNNSTNTNNNNSNNTNSSGRTQETVNMSGISPNLPPVETVGNNKRNGSHPFGSEVTPNALTNHNNNTTHGGMIEVKANESNGKSNVVSPERGGIVGLSALPKSASDNMKDSRTIIATDVQPIKITVKEKPSNADVQSGNVRFPVSATNGISERPSLPPPQPPQEEQPPSEPPKGCCGRLMARCKKTPKPTNQTQDSKTKDNQTTKSLLCCSKNKSTEELQERINSDTNLIETEANEKAKWWQKLKCCRRKKVADAAKMSSNERKDSWTERLDNEPMKTSAKDKCKNFLRTIFCINLCTRKRRKEQEEAINRRASIMSKKKSLTPPVVVEEPQAKLDAGLVEHTSVMKAAIPVLPVPLAWFCLILNCFLPGIGTIVSGFLCLCMGKPRFSQKDGPRPRFGACIIDFFIGCGQLFTVLFCLVGWGWSIWWGIIMLRVAKKYRKIRRAEKAMEEDMRAAEPTVTENHLGRDVERGS